MPTTDMSVHLDPGALADQMAVDVRAGLTSTPKALPPKYFYDARGSELFDQITRLPEYYPTRTERAILDAHVADIAAATRAETLVELGSGTSEKTRLLLRALAGSGTLRRFVPFDVDPAVLAEASEAVGAEFPGVVVEPVVGDFEKHLAEIPRRPRQLLAFLGSTIGNLDPVQRAAFLEGVRRSARSRRRVPARHRPGQGPGPTGGGVRRRAGRDRGVQQERAPRARPRAWAPTSTPTRSRTSPSGTPTTSGSRCGWSRRATSGCAWPRSTSTSTSPRGEQMRTEISAKFRRAGRRARAGGGRAPADALVDRPGGRLRAVAVGAGPTGAAQSSNALTTSSSMVCFGPVNHFLADTFHQIASTMSVPNVSSGA